MSTPPRGLISKWIIFKARGYQHPPTHPPVGLILFLADFFPKTRGARHDAIDGGSGKMSSISFQRSFQRTFRSGNISCTSRGDLPIDASHFAENQSVEGLISEPISYKHGVGPRTRKAVALETCRRYLSVVGRSGQYLHFIVERYRRDPPVADEYLDVCISPPKKISLELRQRKCLRFLATKISSIVSSH